MQDVQTARPTAIPAAQNTIGRFTTRDTQPYQYRWDLASRSMHYLRSRGVTLYPVERLRNRFYRSMLKRHAANIPPLSEPRDAHILNSLRQDGVYITSLSELGLDFSEAAHSRLTDICIDLQRQPLPPNEFVAYAPSEDLVEVPGLANWGLQPRILEIVENYLQLPIAYHGMHLRRDIRNLLEARSRCWHFDLEDNRTLKMIVYLNDVELCDGPFQYLGSDDSIELRQQMNYRLGYLDPESVDKIIPKSRWHSALGKAGTVVMVDTARIIHRGKRSERTDRHALFFDYTSRKPKRPYYCHSLLTPEAMATFANTLPEKHLPYVFWRGIPSHR
ncbi:2OG-Fe(II) oxygenase [filamentous cyanobacterium LEGE 11480]|uniref:2OG-Fe(II) oxygenase n=1 Tax=Romeriopsis navalis LEGE 11480 TaxID=2777977 RepID=A0A928Z3A2_9CYAN|nr:hypothetical protein [Romeriopsis navalis]MBE9029837.1 2OG-Fe(II) oxygenase [Romeriopsis navalis LEGE 11480]